MAETWEQLLARQQGVFTHAQAAEHGLGSGLLRERERDFVYRTIAPRVMYVAAAIVLPRPALLWRAVLTVEGALISHATAAELWGLRLPACDDIHVTIPRGNWVPRRGIRVHTFLPAYPCPGATRHGLPVTTVARSLIDAFGLIESPDDRRTLIAEAFRARRTTVPRMCAAVLTRPQVARRAELFHVIDLAAGGSQSAGEMRLFEFLRRSGLPAPTRQHVPQLPGGRRYIDCALAAYRIAIEYDGRWHLTDGQRHDDQLRDEALRRLKWVSIRVSDRRLRDERRLAADIWANIAEQAERLGLDPATARATHVRPA